MVKGNRRPLFIPGYRTLLTTLLLGAFVFPGIAGPEEGISPIVNLLRKNYDPKSTLSASYSLTIYWSVREKEEKRAGTIKIAPGDRFRITAGEETFVSNGETYWHSSPKANQVVIKRLVDVDISVLPSQLFARFIVSCPFKEQERANGVVRLAWTSDTSSTPYRSIAVWTKENIGRITKCVMTDRNGNVFTYTFTGTMLGTSIPGEAFRFAIPKKATVVDMRK
jgi:outer membrane lipoprotein-sorting protein